MLAKESFDSDGTYSRTFDRGPDQVCEASRRALLSQGYVVSKADGSAVEASKNFQPETDVHEQLSLRVSCIQQPSTGESWAFASATQDRYNLTKRNTSASVGTPLGSLSLPFGSTDDSLVKVASMTVQDANFYRSFFKLVERYLPPSPKAAVIKPDVPAPEPAELPAGAPQSVPDVKESTTPAADAPAAPAKPPSSPSVLAGSASDSSAG